ncbi:hypothetical protein EGH82_08540 [Vibrio ponticus]|uniref:Alginate lyase domain-containing protein n=1 Tax=Vibrio ponticus TaxID=265668 RepID=A0A3N3E1N6_9VIBR|nr:alginate lyase family protein [Vibrio ponticus]ROV60665.1 hypothetical protein EGH82_08540 [Vibrio ponticus]
MTWRHSKLAFVTFFVTACSTDASVVHVDVPPGYIIQMAPMSSKPVPCIMVPPYQGAMNFNSKYRKNDPNKSQVDASLDKKYRQETLGINKFSSYTTKLADRLIASPAENDLRCYLANLENWAKSSSIATSKQVNYVGKAIKKWTLATVASNYLKVQTNYAAQIPSPQDEQIKSWLSKLAWQVVEDYSNRKPTQINNHDYWAAWAVMASATVLNDSELYHWALAGFVYAAEQIDANGFLPNEIKRKQRAANYHNFAMQPLAMLGLFIEQNSPAVYDAHRHQIERLTTNLFNHAMGNPVFEHQTGVEQIDANITINGRSAWLAPYLTYSSAQERQIHDVINLSDNLRSTRLGGDLGFLFYHSTYYQNKE